MTDKIHNKAEKIAWGVTITNSRSQAPVVTGASKESAAFYLLGGNFIGQAGIADNYVLRKQYFAFLPAGGSGGQKGESKSN